MGKPKFDWALLFLKYSEVFGEKRKLSRIKKTLGPLNLSRVLTTLAQINVPLSFETLAKDNPRIQTLQDNLSTRFLDQSIREHSKFIAGRADGHFAFTRQQILTLMRLAALECSTDSSAVVIAESSSDLSLGECCLAINDHLASSRQDRAIDTGTGARKHINLALKLAPNLELYNPQRPELAIARADRMFAQILTSKLWIDRFQKKLKGFDLAATFRDATGLTLERYRDFVLAIVSFYSSRKTEQLVTNPESGRIDPDKFIGGTLLSKEAFERYLALDSITIAELPKAMAERRPVLPYFDFVIFRKSPLIQMNDGYLLCADPSFLLEKLSAGFHWTILNSIQEDVRNSAFQAFGYLFELYVDELFSGIYPPDRFISFASFEKARDEAFDGMIICPGGHLIVLEYKGGFLTIGAKYSGKVRKLEKELDKKFGRGAGAGVRQLSTKLEKLFHRKIAKRDRISALDGLNITKVTPVLIAQESFLRFRPMNFILNRWFNKLVRKMKITKAIEIAPLQVIDIDSLQRLKANLAAGDFTFEQCLNRRAIDNPSMTTTFHEFTWSSFPQYGRREDSDLMKQLESIFERIEKEFFGIHEMEDAANPES
jgi:hypothetical protein